MSTQTINILVPSSGFGLAVDVSSLVGEKTVILSGRYQGAYVLYGSHDDSHFAPLLIFNAGGIESIRQTFSGALRSVVLKSLASGSSGVVANISGLSVPSDNSFTSIGPVGKGFSGLVDLGDSSYQTDLNFMGFGRLNGVVVVEGSSDGMSFNPIGEFSASPSGASLLGGGGIEFSPLGTKDKVRYVRLNVLGDVPDSFIVTIGGAQSDSGGGGETLHDAYLAGVVSVDQTLVLSNANGGKVVFDASNPVEFTDSQAVQVLVPGGVGVAFLSGGGMVLGPNNIEIGLVRYPAYGGGSFLVNTAIGPEAHAHGYDLSAGSANVALGYFAMASGDSNVAVGPTVQSINDIGSEYFSQRGCVAVGSNNLAHGMGCIAVGFECSAGTISLSVDSAIAMGTGAFALFDGALAVGQQSVATLANDVAVGPFASANGGAGVAVGLYALSEIEAVAIGFSANAYGFATVSVGPGSAAWGENGVAVGEQAYAGENNDTSVGYLSRTDGEGSSAFGAHSAVTIPYGVAVGYGAASTGGLALGAGASAGVTSCVIDINRPTSISGTFGSVSPSSPLSGAFGSASDSIVNPGLSTTLTAVGTLPSGLTAGQSVTISSSSFYDGTWVITNVDLAGGTFDISTPFTSDDSGDWSSYIHGSMARVTSVGSLPLSLSNGDQVTISGSSHYNGNFRISNLDRIGGMFDILTLFIAGDTGNWLVYCGSPQSVLETFSVLGSNGGPLGATTVGLSSGDTGLSLCYRDNSGAYHYVAKVTIGANGSGGSGYALLRVPNS